MAWSVVAIDHLRTIPSQLYLPILRVRQYLDYLIQRKQQSAGTLTNYFKINFGSQDPDEIWTCIRLLEKDFAVNNISHTPRPQWEAAGAGGGIPLVAPH